MYAPETSAQRDQHNDNQVFRANVNDTWEQTIATTALRIRQSSALTEVLQATVDQVQHLLACDRVLIYKFLPDGSGEVITEAVSTPEWSILDRVIHDPCFQSSWLEPYQEGHIYAVEDIATADLTPCHRDFLAQFQVRANLVVPLLNKNQLWGLVIAHHCTAPRLWPPAAREGLRQIAVHVGIAVHQDSLVQQLHQAATDLEAQVAERTQELAQANQQLVDKILERNHTTAQVSQREEFLRRVLDSLFAFVGVMTPNGILIETNQAPLEAAGLTRADVIGKPFAEAYWWTYSTESHAAIRQATARAAQGESVRFDIPIQIRGGKQIVIDFALTPLRDQAGTITHLIPSGIDITDRLQAETELRRNQNQMRQLATIVESSQDAIISKTSAGIVTSWNRAAETLFGYTAQEMIGQPITVIIPSEHQEEAASIFASIYRGEAVNTYETQRLRKDGQLVNVALTISPLYDSTGHIIGASKIARDITQRKRAEAQRLRSDQLRQQAEQALGDSQLRFQNFMDNAPLLSWSVSRGGYIEYANLAWLKFMGHTEATALGQSLESLFPSNFAAAYRHNNQQVLRTGQVLETCEQAIDPDGKLHHFLVRKFPVYENGQMTSIGGIAIDISEQKQAEVLLRNQAETLRIFYATSPLMMGLVEISDDDILHLSDNPASLNFFDKTAAELANQWASQIGVPTAALQLWLRHYRQSQQQQRPVQFDYEHVTPSARHWLLVTVSFVGTGDSGRPKFSYIVQDLSEKKRLEGEKAKAFSLLQNSEQRYASLVAAVPVGIFRIDAHGQCIYVNERWSQLSGLSLEQALGKGWGQAIHPDDRDLVMTHWQQAMLHQRPFELEHRYQSSDGHIAWVYGQAVPEHSAEGQLLGYVGTITDITDRKQVEAERLRAEKAHLEFTLLEQILDIVLAGYWDWDIPSGTEYLSPGLKRMFGYADHELPNCPETWQNLIFPEDLPTVLEQFERHIQSHGTEPYYNEVRYRHKDGSTVWVICSGQVIEWDDENNPLRIIGCHIDITERKRIEANLRQSEATNRALIQAIPDFLVRMRQDGSNLEIINQGAMRLLPFAAQPEVVNQSMTDTMPSAIAQERIRLAQQAIATGTIQWQEYEFEDQGQHFFEEARITPLWDDEVLVVVRNITERKRATRELKATKEQLELFIRATSEGFWDWHLVTNEIYFSPRWKEMLGYSDHELDNTLAMWESLIFEEDHTAALQLIEDYNSGRANRFSTVQRFHHKNGSTVYVLSRAIHLKDDQGNVIRMVGSHLDITSTIHVQAALRNSEMQLSGILNSSLDGIMAFRAIRDDQGQIVDFEWLLSNPTACDLVEKAPETLIGKRLLEEMPGNRENGLFDLYSQVVETGEPIQRQFHYSHEGLDSWFENIAVKLGDGFAVTFRNISAIKESEQALQQANQNLEQHLHDLKQRNQEMLLLSETSDFLQACRTIKEACAVISTLVQPLFPDCSGAFFITNTSRNRVEQVAAWGDHVHSQTAFPPHDCWALRRGRWHQIGQDRLGLSCNHVSATAADLYTLCIPMIAQGETLGLFYLNAPQAEILSTAKRQLARTVAEQVGLAIANLYLRETLQNQSIRDPLTGLFNRRYLEEALQQEIARALRNHYAIGMVMVDVDHFKQFNDTYGHDAGDFVLQTIGQVLKDNIRGSDIACRYGGEEMTLVFPETNLQEATIRAEQLRQAIGQLAVTYNGQQLDALTASFGVAAFPDHGAVGSALIQAADAALYRAKAAGRNRVMAVDTRPQTGQP